MGLGKTLSIVSLIAATRQAAMKFSKAEIAAAPTPEEAKPELDPNTIKTKVFGMPDIPDLDEKGKKRKRDDEPIKLASTLLRSRGTLLVCPMSTISNWEDQIREHWNGDVEVIGGASGQMVKPPEKVWKAPKRTKKGESSEEDDLDEFDALKIYVYHGPSRTPDPAVIADFDIVITSYNTLANEYSKSGGASCDDTPADTANNSDEEFDTGLNTGALPVKPDVEAEIKANEVAEALRKKKKSAKGSAVKAPERSPLQSIQWFRVVLDEAQ
jgi:SWI/SNF-related matrix-associated actin-dependent regulator of chromatin subfamily A3